MAKREAQACQKFACAIQDCLQVRRSQEQCADVIEAFYKCCDEHYEKSRVICPEPQANPVTQRRLQAMMPSESNSSSDSSQ
ncbi:MAG: hypothetical protein MHM6MM_007842 [Cercozoa sp. M6MM]